MTNIDTPAQDIGGHSTTSDQRDADHLDLAHLPAKLRVHALAKLLGASSREIIAVLADLGEQVRGAQSSVGRDIALRVVDVLLPDPPDGDAGIDRPDDWRTDSPGGRTEAAGGGQREVASAAALAPLFAAPQALFLPPQPAPPQPAPPQPAAAEPAAAEPTPVVAGHGQRSSNEDGGDTESAETAELEDDDDDGGLRRRRRRGRRGRGRGRGSHGDEANEADSDEAVDGQAAATVAEDEAPESQAGADEQHQASDDAQDETDEGSTRRRRRRRRRKNGAEDEPAAHEDDPPNTVVHVRDSRTEAPATTENEVRSVKGSTRLEAKRQRRRDGREAGRRRAPVLSEAEFLARREAVDRTMVVRERSDRIQIGVLEDAVLVEHFVTSAGSGSVVGNVYLGRVQNVLPSMEAAFVDIGRGRNAVLYAGEVDWDAAGLEGKARKIEQALSTGDSIVVQVTKDPVGHKGARLTTQISLPGRFLVYVPGGGATGISRKLPDTERKRLKDILKRVVPEDAGVIIRTASEGISEEELGRDVRRLQAQWEVINGKAEQQRTQAPQLLYEEPDLLIKVVRDLFTEDFSSLVVQGSDAWDTIEGYVKHVAPDLAGRLRRHVGVSDVFGEHRIDEQLTKALDRKVWLPSGGYLVIDRTEAMTVIDVNTGKFTGSGGNLEETVTRNNLEAAEEIVRQLRLRDIGGIIVVDFIDMVLESNRDLVLRRLTECLGRDRTRHQVAEVTSLGLVQMTRKRVGTGLLESFSTVCEHCRGRGVLVSTDLVQSPGSAQAASNHNAPAAQAAASPPERQSSGSTRRSRNRGRGDHAAEVPAEVPEVPLADEEGGQPTEPRRSADTASSTPSAEQHTAPETAVHSEPERKQEARQPDVTSAHTPDDRASNDEQPSQIPEQTSVERSAQVEQQPPQPAQAELNGHAHGGGESTDSEPQPVPVVAAARRRSRRAVSRPAGPPVNAFKEG